MFKLSVCLIVKDEESVIERCLNCAKEFADEIIVVDTGSTDKTKEIAQRFTNMVYNYAWTDDFSAARNYSFSLAKYEYIMWLDADDYITAENINKILELKKSNSDDDVFMLKYQIAFDQNNNPTFTYFRERILKRQKNFKWFGFVHEVITPTGKIKYLDIAIQHRKIKSSNPKRNLELYNKRIKGGYVLNSRETFYYARELFYNLKYKKCISVLKKYIKDENAFLINRIDGHKILAECYIKTNEKQKALEVLINSLKIATPSAEICCLIGDILLEKNLKEAIFWFKTALICEKNPESGAFIEESYYDFIPYMQLCYANYKLGDFNTAKHYHNLSKKINPANPSVLFNEKFFS